MATKAEAARLNGKKGGRPRKSPAPATEQVTLATTAAPTKPVDPPADVPPLENPFELTPKELLFVEAYCGIASFSAAKAYDLAGYSMRGSASATRVNAIRVLAKPKVEAAVAAKLAVRVQRLRTMDGDEALERLTLYARADIGKVLDPTDPIALLPEEVRLTIKAVRPNQFGRTIELYDSMKATELMAKSAGKLKETVKVEHTLEDVIALSNARRDGAAA